MLPKKIAKDSAAKRRKDAISTELKITGKLEHDLCVADLTKQYVRSSPTICTILKKKEDIKKLDVAKGVTMITKQLPKLIDDEKLLIKENQLRRFCL